MKRAPKNRIHFHFLSFIQLMLLASLMVGGAWVLLIGVHYLGFPLPKVDPSQFFSVGLFAVSTFGLIVFLTMIPLQTAANALSESFFYRIFKNIKTHLALYVLLVSALLCFFQPLLMPVPYFNELFYAIILSCIFSIVLHRFWTIQLLQEPWVAYKYIKQMNWEEHSHLLWEELYECLLKAIKQGRVKDANYFVEILAMFYHEVKDFQDASVLKGDIASLYVQAQELGPIKRFMDSKWSFVKAG